MQLILIRGLPGSGKSTLARALYKAGFKHFEADSFHLNEEGDYCFDPANIKAAHAWCQDETRKALAQGYSVVVSNTFTQIWELTPYLEMAKFFGIEPNIVETKGNWENVHYVPSEIMERMRARWESL
jgi:predicted kinase